MNSKNRLQEFCQSLNVPFPKYKSYKRGPDHAPEFDATVIITIEGQDLEMKTSRNRSTIYSNKKDAEFAAAQKMLDYLEQLGLPKNLNIEQNSKNEVQNPKEHEEQTAKEYTVEEYRKLRYEEEYGTPADIASYGDMTDRTVNTKPIGTFIDDNTNFVFIDLENASNCIVELKKVGVERLKDRILIGCMSSLSPMVSKTKELENLGIRVHTVKSSVKDAADVLLVVLVAQTIATYGKNISITVVTRDHYAGALVDVLSSEVKIEHLASCLEF